MATTDQKIVQRFFRHQRLRKKIIGSQQKPRLYVFRSLNHLHAQIIDDDSGKVLFGMSTVTKNLRTQLKTGGNVQAAEVLGETFAKEIVKKGYKKVCFDRGGYKYHGRVKAFADAARKSGLEF